MSQKAPCGEERKKGKKRKKERKKEACPPAQRSPMQVI
jgi:hypothetical protein